QARDGGAELLLDVLLCESGVFGDVVKDGGGQRLVVQSQLGEDIGDRQDVLEIGFAGGPLLAGVRLLRDLAGMTDDLHLLRRARPRYGFQPAVDLKAVFTADAEAAIPYTDHATLTAGPCC